jgi:ribonucleotide reductase alpha subunit
MRMGIGVTGVLQSTEEQVGWLDDCYKHLRQFDWMYSTIHKWPISIKLTTVKPSGTLSLLPGVTPGIHPGYARHMIRRIRIASNHPLVSVCREHGYDVEYQRNFDGSEDRGTVVVSFPFRYPDNAVLAKDMTAIDQLKLIGKLQTIWSDNSVSCTVYYKKEEIPAIKAYLAEHYTKEHKSLSFLLHSDHGFQQAPYEEITEELYNQLVKNTKLITQVDEITFDELDADCASGACPVR